MKPPVPSGFYLILDHDALTGRSLMDAASAAVAGGVRHIQYRAKGLSGRDAYFNSLQLSALAHRSGVTLVINDRVDLALAVEADGVHLGQEDLPLSAARSLLGPDRVIGVSAHTLEQAREAEAGGADYLGVGPVFSSTTKQARPPLGCEALKEFRRQARIPVIAIGGITLLNLRQVMDTQVDGVAVVSAVLSQSDPARAASEFMRILHPD
ncbi:MAG: thiamine phosphate synthase [Nitrospirae bacterium]|nr:thiamine phosphate synthase [Nitrospirota bacterium]